MPFPRRFFGKLLRASLYYLLAIVVIPLTTMAIPVITKEFSKPATPAIDTLASKLADEVIFDLRFEPGE